MDDLPNLTKAGPHSHYGEQVQAELKRFNDAWLSYSKVCGLKTKQENYHRLDTIQGVWNALLKARREETGVGWYLTKEQHSELTQQKNGNYR